MVFQVGPSKPLKLFVHKILYSPIRENAKCPRGLPTVDDINPAVSHSLGSVR